MLWCSYRFRSRSRSLQSESRIQGNTYIALHRKHRLDLKFLISELCQVVVVVEIHPLVSESFHRAPQTACQCLTMSMILISMEMKWTKVNSLVLSIEKHFHSLFLRFSDHPRRAIVQLPATTSICSGIQSQQDNRSEGDHNCPRYVSA